MDMNNVVLLRPSVVIMKNIEYIRGGFMHVLF